MSRVTSPSNPAPAPDEFAPHWSAQLSKGTLTVTFEIRTTLADIPDVGLVDLLREAVANQRTRQMADWRVVVSGEEVRTRVGLKTLVRTHIALLLLKTRNIRDVSEWELCDNDGRLIDQSLTVNAMFANYPCDRYWLSPRVGIGA